MNREISAYVTVKGGVFSELDKRVNEHILNNWQPFGNAYTYSVDLNCLEEGFAQTMVRYKKEKK